VKTLLDIPQVFTLVGVEYFLDWGQVAPGNSFFIPTVATIRQVKSVLNETCKDLPYTFIIRTRCEYGRYGVRVWRLL